MNDSGGSTIFLVARLAQREGLEVKAYRDVVISDHAAFQIVRRCIALEVVRKVAQSPQQVVRSRKGKMICQSLDVDRLSGKTYLIRVVVERRADSLYVLTVYRTSKIEKYWQED